MKSILQPIALACAVFLISSCDSGGASGITNIGVTPAVPQNGITGSAVKGIISGGVVTVADASGADVPLASGGTTGADGTYNLVFTEAAIDAGITAPLVVTVTGGTMTCDIDLPNTANDCAVGDGTSVAFGATYDLPATFTMRGLVSVIPVGGTNNEDTVTVNLSPASDLAADLALASANGSMLTVAEVDAAGAQVLGLIQTITGTDLAGLTLNEIGVPNIADSASAAAASNASRAIAAFGAAVIANQGAGESVADVIARINASLLANADGNLQATGTVLAGLTASVITALETVAAQVAEGAGDNAQVIAAANNAETIAAIYMAMGAAAVEVSPIPTIPTEGPVDALVQTKAFINKFSATIGTALATTGGGGVGADDQGATELFAAELDVITRLNEGPASNAAQALETAVLAQVAAITADTTEPVAFSNADGAEANANPVSFSISKAGGVYSLTDISSTWTSMAGTVVVITAASGSSSGDDVFSLVDVLMVTTTPATTEGGDPVVAQTFTGGTISGDGSVTTFDGTLTGAPAVAGEAATTSFGINIVYTDPVDMLDGDTYTATVSFASATAEDLSAMFSGTVGALTQSLSITAGDNTIALTATETATGETVKFSDGMVMMTIELVDGVVVVDQAGDIATLTVTGTETATGTIDSNGTVTYSDDSFQSLPAGIF